MPSYYWRQPPRKTHRMKSRVVVVLVAVAFTAVCVLVWRANTTARPPESGLPPGEQNCIVQTLPNGGKEAICWRPRVPQI
jgi:hypothetical protein